MADFKILPNLETNYKKMRFYTLTFISFCLIVCLGALMYSYMQVQESKRVIYVLDKSGSMMLATNQDAKMSRPIEAREHVRRFHDLLLTLTPDDKAINNNLNSAIAMADNSAYVYYSDLAEKGYYQRIVNGDMIQTIICDSIKVNMDSYPYTWRYYGKQRITRASLLETRNFVSEGGLVDVVRSDNNPSGFMLTQFRVLDNSKINSTERRGFNRF
nr:conjugative transposon protein TraK [uncultured Porphyromonas sp.]